jgi:hypothetical protein
LREDLSTESRPSLDGIDRKSDRLPVLLCFVSLIGFFEPLPEVFPVLGSNAPERSISKEFDKSLPSMLIEDPSRFFDVRPSSREVVFEILREGCLFLPLD